MNIPEILLVESEHKPGSLAKILAAIGEAGGLVDHLNMVRREQGKTVWEITVEGDETIHRAVESKINALTNARLMGRSDRVFTRHEGGKIRMISRLPLVSQQELRDIYTPGVARVCMAIHKDPSLAWRYTYLSNAVAIVTNGTRVLGLGNIGPLASLPVMEGKAALFARFVDISAVPILLEETDPARIVEIVMAISPSFGAIQLEDISSPACFEIEEQLRKRLDKPVLHDDQHGTAVVALAALLNVMQRLKRDLRTCVVGQLGFGAAGFGIARLLSSYGVGRLMGADLNTEALSRVSTLGGEPSTLEEVMRTADVVIATTGRAGLIKPEMVRPGQVILALTNPAPEITPQAALSKGASFAADGGSVNNMLGYPGLFRGALNARAKHFTDDMLLAASRKLAELAQGDELLPTVLDRNMHAQVAQAVYEAAIANPLAVS